MAESEAYFLYADRPAEAPTKRWAMLGALAGAVEAPVLDGFRDVLDGEMRRAGEIRDGPGHLEDAIVASRGQAETRNREREKVGRRLRERAPSPGLTSVHARVDAHGGP